MGRDFVVAVCLLLLAAGLFMLPGDYLRAARLHLYGLYARISGAAGQIEAQAEPVVTAEVGLPARVAELNNLLVLKDAEISRLRRDLRQLADFRTAFPLVAIVPVRVLGFSGGSEGAELILNAGTEQGLARGDALAQGAAYVGSVALVGPQTSLALPLTHPGSVVAARTAISRDICAVRGRGGQRVLVVIYASQSAITPGEKVITSGLSGTAPEGLVIGTITDYPRRGSEPGTLEADLRLEAEMSSLEDIIVIRAAQPVVPENPRANPGSGATRGR